jgi:hypothetical protein
MPSKFKPWLLLVLVFFAGIATGIIGTRHVIRNFGPRLIGNPDWIRDRMERELGSELSLNAEQQAKVHKIFQDSQRDLGELRKEFGPRFGEIMKRSEKQIEEVLTLEQQAKYEKFLQEKKALWRPPGNSPKPPFGGRPLLDRNGQRRPPANSTP